MIISAVNNAVITLYGIKEEGPFRIPWSVIIWREKGSLSVQKKDFKALLQLKKYSINFGSSTFSL